MGSEHGLVLLGLPPSDLLFSLPFIPPSTYVFLCAKVFLVLFFSFEKYSRIQAYYFCTKIVNGTYLIFKLAQIAFDVGTMDSIQSLVELR